MYTLSIANQKGGVGKSSLALAIAAGLKRNGRKVLVVDFDGQGNCTSCYNGSKAGYTITDALQGKITAKQATIYTPNGDIIGSNIRLSTEKPLDGKPITTLKDTLAPLQADYDFCVIDTAPEFSEKLTNALIASDGVLVPMQSDIFSIESLDIFMLSFNACKKRNPKLALLGIVMSMFEGKAIVNQDNYEAIQQKAKEYGTRVFKTPVRKTVVIKEAQNMYNPDIFDYAPRSNASKDYWAIVNELLEVLNDA